MTWRDRLKPASYTPPGGQALTFQYVDVSASAELRGTRYDFSGREGTYAQPTGSSGRVFPLRLLIDGPDYDIAAEALFEALRVPGTGVLSHPVHGSINVVPMGKLDRRDNLVTGANVAVIDVTFWETIGALFPSGQTDPASAVAQTVVDYNNDAAQDYEDALDVSTELEKITVVSQVRALTDTVRGILAPVAEATESTREQFNEIYNSISQGVDTVIGSPLDLAFQISLLIQSPGRSAELWGDKLSAYRDLADQIFATSPASVNEFKTSDLYASGALTGTIVSAVNTQFNTQPEALIAAQNILLLAEDLTVWRDTFAPDDTGFSYSAWQQAAAIAAGFLVEISFSLAQERTVTLTRDRTIIDTCAELYGEIDTKLDFFITSNALSGSEIVELPAGKTIKYYV